MFHLRMLVAWSTMLALLLCAAPAAVGEEDVADGDIAMAEDLEIMGALLHGAMHSVYEGGHDSFWRLHHGVAVTSDAGAMGLGGGGSPSGAWGEIWGMGAGDAAAEVKQKIQAPLAARLDDVGVVFQLELPGLAEPRTHEQKPAVDETPVSAWEAMRRRLRGESATKNGAIADARFMACGECHSGPAAGHGYGIHQYPGHRHDLAQWMSGAKHAGAPTREELVAALTGVLAENGHQFRGLAADERLIVAITFRPAGDAAAAYPAPGGGSNPYDAGGYGAGGYGGDATDRAVDYLLTRPVGAAPNDSMYSFYFNAAPKSNHEITGDLQWEQQKYDAAVESYQKAWRELKETPDAAGGGLSAGYGGAESSPYGGEQPYVAARRTLSQKIARALASLPDSEKANSLREELKALGWKQEDVNAAANGESSPTFFGHFGFGRTANPLHQRRRLPARLTFSVTKDSLDRVAAGELSLEEFQQQATVRFVDPAAPSTKPK